eukprot:COSAG06_NODE_13292_length_1272_cov_5.182438_1_plen_365_part_01
MDDGAQKWFAVEVSRLRYEVGTIKVRADDAADAVDVAQEQLDDSGIDESAIIWTLAEETGDIELFGADPAATLTDAPAPAPAPAKWGVVQPQTESEDSLVPTLAELAIDLGRDALRGASPRSALEKGLQIQQMRAQKANDSARALTEEIEQAEQRVARLQVQLAQEQADTPRLAATIKAAAEGVWAEGQSLAQRFKHTAGVAAPKGKKNSALREHIGKDVAQKTKPLIQALAEFDPLGNPAMKELVGKVDAKLPVYEQHAQELEAMKRKEVASQKANERRKKDQDLHVRPYYKGSVLGLLTPVDMESNESNADTGSNESNTDAVDSDWAGLLTPVDMESNESNAGAVDSGLAGLKHTAGTGFNES